MDYKQKYFELAALCSEYLNYRSKIFMLHDEYHTCGMYLSGNIYTVAHKKQEALEKIVEHINRTSEEES